MTESLSHRGPDSSGVWWNAKAQIGLGHRRLSILDLSSLGHQPMPSHSGRYQIVYNGEIYNFRNIRQRLECLGHVFRGDSDTEVILAAIEQWGLRRALKEFVGMFAFALWDSQKQTLNLVRDRLGIKPLYYGYINKSFTFASELKAFSQHPNFDGLIDPDSVALMIRHSFVPTPFSIYRNIKKLPPGHILSVRKTESFFSSELKSYWNTKNVVERALANPFAGSESDAIVKLDRILGNAVNLRMIADVPLGAFLSGGIDSSLVVALMQSQSNKPVRTFSIGFENDCYDEGRYARAVADHLKTDHAELYITSKEAMSVIPGLPTIYDEPFSDPSQIPTFLVSRLAREHVTVSLTGDGGDELFGGYKRYVATNKLWNSIGWLPKAGRCQLGKLIRAVPINVYDRVLGCIAPYLNKYGGQGAVGDKLHKLAHIIQVDRRESLYLNMFSHWKEPGNVVIDANILTAPSTDPNAGLYAEDFYHLMMYIDTVTYLPDDILVKVDRASMAVGLEVRVPLIDHRVFELAWQIPISMKIRNGRGKWLLRQLLYRYVPKELIERPKLGFGIPLDTWLREGLREWAESLLDEKTLREDGYFNTSPVLKKWMEHISGERNWGRHLWNILMFQGWLHNRNKPLS